MSRVSVIIPNLHSPVVGQTIASVRNQDSAVLREIIVVGQDRHGQVCSDDVVRFIRTPQPVTPAVARNMGARAARGELLAFIDADCLAADDWLVRLTEPYVDSGVTVVGGSVTFPADNYWTFSDNLATFHEYLPVTRRGTREILPSLNLSMYAATLAGVGWFDERYPFAAGEDADLSLRLRLGGHRLQFEPSAVVTHCPQRRSASALLVHAYRFGRYSPRVDARYWEALGVPRLFRHGWAILLAAPLLAADVIRRMVLNDGLGLRYVWAWPAVYLAKLAWCAGAAGSLWRRGAEK